MENMMSISVTSITAQRDRWQEETRNVQKHVSSLQQELVRLQSQLEQLSGALQACDVIVGFAETQTDPLVDADSDI